MAAPTKLTLYNGALLAIGERSLASLSEDREPRRALDEVWTDAVDYCLGLGQWKFAKRTVEMASETGIEPSFGYLNVYAFPADHIRTAGVFSDEYGQCPLTDYAPEQAYFYADIEPVFLSYISNDAEYGSDYSLWPAEFARVVEYYMASRVARRLTQNDKIEEKMEKKLKAALLEAKNTDAMEGPTAFPPVGGWVKARMGNWRRDDRGRRDRLVG